MDTPISTEKVREKASQICLEYLQVMLRSSLMEGIVNISNKETIKFFTITISQGVWRNVPAHQLQIRQISGGLSNLVFFVGLPPGVQPKGQYTKTKYNMLMLNLNAIMIRSGARGCSVAAVW